MNTVMQMDKYSIDTAIVVDDNKVLGIFTMGDFRRAVLDGLDIKSNISPFINRNYVFFLEGSFTDEDVIQLFNDNWTILNIPVVDAQQGLISVLNRNDYIPINSNQKFMEGLNVVVMAGGKGTRLDPFTRILPKPLIPIGDDPIIKIIMDEFGAYGISKFYLSINDKANMIKAYFHDHKLPYNIEYLEEDKPLGTAGVLSYFSGKVQNNIIVTNCDVIIRSCYASVVEFHIDGGFDLTLVASMQHYTIPYGVCELNEFGQLDSIREKPQQSYLVNTGLYILTPQVLSIIPKNKYFDMTDLITKAKDKGLKVGVYPVSEKSWLDVGQWEEYANTLRQLDL